jgi:hypothetical protein
LSFTTYLCPGTTEHNSHPRHTYAVFPRFNKHMQNFLYFSSCSSHPIPMN